VRKPLDLAPASGHRRLALALLCALAGCLNPRPEEYPSETAGDEAAGAPAAADPSRQGADNFDPTSAGEEADSPEPAQPVAPPEFIIPAAPADAGADAGDGGAGEADAGVPAISE
jgi:hypothetical protein